MRQKNLPNAQIYWLCQTGGWFSYWLLGTFLNLLNADQSEGNPTLLDDQILLIVFVLLGLIITHIYRLVIKAGKWVRLPISKLIVKLVISVIGLSFSSIVFYLLITIAIGILPSNALSDSLFLFQVFVNTALINTLWTAIYFTVQYFKNYRKSQITQLKQESLVKEATLNKLRSQLNPHFIFNSLNSIRALISENPERARHAVTALSNIFRKTLQLDKSSLVSIHEEIQIVNDYINLEKIRYEERLQVTQSIDPATLQAKVPPLMLQTLVENGIKHGISNLPNGGEIKIEIRKNTEQLILELTNSGQLNAMTKSKGYGLKNTKERLDLLFEGRATFEIYNHDKKNVKTIITIPIENP